MEKIETKTIVNTILSVVLPIVLLLSSVCFLIYSVLHMVAPDLNEEIGVWQTEDGAVVVESEQIGKPAIKFVVGAEEHVYQLVCRDNKVFGYDTDTYDYDEKGVIIWSVDYQVLTAKIKLKDDGKTLTIKIEKDDVLGNEGKTFVLYKAN